MKGNMLYDARIRRRSVRYIIAVFLFLYSQGMKAEDACGVLIGGFEKDCIVIRNKDMREERATIGMLLYPNDLITQKKGLESVQLKLSDNARKKFFRYNIMGIMYKSSKKRYMDVSPAYLKLLERAVHLSRIAATRDVFVEPVYIEKLKPKPGRKVTVLPGDVVLFSWNSWLARFLVIKDSKQREVLKIDIHSKAYVKIKVDDFKVEPSSSYRWGIEVEGIRRTRTDNVIRFVDNDVKEIVEKNLEIIEKAQMNSTARKLEKAAFFQLISDFYEERGVDFYWKSAEILTGISREELENLDKKGIEILQLLKINYKTHHESI